MAHQHNKLEHVTAGAIGFGSGSTTGSVTVTQPARQGPRRDGGTLIVVVEAVEFNAVVDAVAAVNARPTFTPRFLRGQTVFELGIISRTELFLARVGPGGETPHSAGPSVAELIADLAPAHVILTGICYGLKEDDAKEPQRIGDVVVADQVRLIAHRKMAQDAGRTEVRRLTRGGEVHPSHKLLDRFRTASVGWTRSRVRFGPVVTESVLVNSFAYREEIRAVAPEAIAGEMEGRAVYTAAVRNKIDWILVKGICDWGHDKQDSDQTRAAENAAALVVRVVEMGGLDAVTPPRAS
ncbi:hypothetical protein Ais01nite_10030 [Asanoa ishikariensis]|uniref:Adenosylhomocysteine nucleosidase n=1 Tax=Asanoa ishikariensis TaxID=137265 RepID=A0A1H3T6L7_9ACTN|nr:hypothetical protein [Asanoa ishikariensis]GIF62968.1 hypothetical protein Ais01nite_10030 [Asanoa ishikariensis]SDZ45567.1 adenosylhomocysteine nucleosidase [Asanoa ishikariensis]